MPTDNELMLAHARGDPEAFDELFRRYSGLVLGFMRKDLWRPEVARDLTQQTFLQLHRSRHDFKASGNLRSWLMTIARNMKYDYMRREQRRPRSVHIEGADFPGAGQEAGQVEARDTLDHALAGLPENQSVVIRLHWLEHLPFAEIARRLGATESAVKVRAHRAYQALRERIAASEGRSAGDAE